MRPKSIILLVLAAGCGLIASIGISQVIDNNNRNAPVDTVPIYVALQNINLGDPIEDGMVSLQEWPKDKIPPGALTQWEDIEERRPRTTIFQGEPLLDSKLLIKGQSHDPIAAIPKNHRLKTISVDARRSAAGLLSPGDRVDIQLFVKRNERAGIHHAFTKTILQNIRVFAVDQTVQRSTDDADARTIAKTISLILTPSQANRVTLAENLGDISLIPRNPDDDSIVDDAEIDSKFLLGLSDSNNRRKEQGLPKAGNGGLSGFLRGAIGQAAPKQTQTSTFRMKIIYPDEMTEIEFDADGEPITDQTHGDAGGFSTGPYVAPTTGGTSNSDGDRNADADADGADANGDEEFPIPLRRK